MSLRSSDGAPAPAPDGGHSDGQQGTVLDDRALLLLQVKSVFASTALKMAIFGFDNVFFKRFVKSLLSSFKLPCRLKALRILRCIWIVAMTEINLLVEDAELILEDAFAASNSDLWTRSETKESYICVCMSFVAMQYAFKDGRNLFISDTSLKKRPPR